MKTFKHKLSKEELLENVSEEELDRLRAFRNYDRVGFNSFSGKILLFTDTLRLQLRKHKSLIEKRLWNIRDIQNNVLRLKTQLVNKEIVEELKNGVKMNPDEIRSLIQHNNWTMRGEFESIPIVLAEIRSLVGHIDVAKKVILTEKEYERYGKNILMGLKELGYDFSRET